MPESVGRPVVEAGAAKSVRPVTPAPVPEGDVIARLGGEEEPRVDPPGEALERVDRDLRERHRSERAVVLPVGLQAAGGVYTADVEDAAVPVDVAAFERDPFLGS